jgi:glycosyltransferase involved in cell wall biosynthesis
MKVLFLTKYPPDGASSRYRVYQYLPFLDAAGIGYHVQPFMSPAMYALVNAPGRRLRKAGHSLAALLRRLAQLWRCGRYDLVFLQREALPLGPPLMERLLRRWRIPTIFDYDDALFIVKASTHNSFVDRFKSGARTEEVFGLVDCVLAGNDWLRERAAAHGAAARTLHVAEDLQRCMRRPPHRNAETLTLGWLGSPSTEKYLDLLREPLRALCRRHPQLRLLVVGGGAFTDAQIPVEHLRWDYASEIAHLHRFDIGLMPLPLEEWSLGKSGGKARTYMAAGVPAVCTRIGFNTELIRHGETGLLVREPGEWEAALEALIADAGLRERIAAAARHEVEQRYSLQQLGPQFVDILREVAHRGRPA